MVSRAIVTLVIGCAALCTSSAQPVDSTSVPVRTAIVPSTLVVSLNDALSSVSRVATPSVVSISIPMQTTDLKRLNLYEEWLRYYGFQSRGERAAPRMIGSGVFISETGLIVTNNHVVEDGNFDSIVVTTSDGESYLADLVGRDGFTDLAVLRIYGSKFQVPRFVDSDSLRVGTIVVAVGNPFGLSSTVTQGIVSALRRGEINEDEDDRTIRSFVQIDAAINPGNSGGGLFDIYGNLVGINTAIFSGTGYFAGYGFAIPSNIVQAVTQDLVEDGKVDRGVLGIEAADLNDSTAAALGFDVRRGVLVTALESYMETLDSSGLRVNDVIVAVNGRPVRSGVDIQSVTIAKRQGDKVSVSIWRPDGNAEVVVRLRTASELITAKAGTKSAERKMISTAVQSTASPQRSGYLGLETATIDLDSAQGSGSGGGLRVSSVNPFGAAFKAGILRGDILVEVNGKTISSADHHAKEMHTLVAGDRVEFVVLRNGTRLTRTGIVQPGR